MLITKSLLVKKPTAKKAEPTPKPTPKPPSENGDSVSLGYKILKNSVATVGAGAGLLIGSVKGGVQYSGSNKMQAPKLVHRVARYAGAIAGVAAAGMALTTFGPLAAVGALVVAPVLGAGLGAAAVSGGEAVIDAGVGTFKGMKGGASLGWQIAGGAVDKVAGWFGHDDPPAKPEPPSQEPPAKEVPPADKSKETPPKAK